MAILNSEVWVARPLSDVFSFFSDPANLEVITPSWLHFEILPPRPTEVKAGTLIDYRLRIHGIPLRWQSEITVWDPPHRFVDEQRRGPYRVWIHEHTFEAKNGGTLATDRVEYSVVGGKLINWLFVERDLDKIFKYRRHKLLTMFGPSV